jgi:hypothetical protein
MLKEDGNFGFGWLRERDRGLLLTGGFGSPRSRNWKVEVASTSDDGAKTVLKNDVRHVLIIDCDNEKRADAWWLFVVEKEKKTIIKSEREYLQLKKVPLRWL